MKKRMLEIKDGAYFINSSSVEIISTCRRKAQYALELGLRSEEESEALVFGKAIHAALAAFYNGQRDLEYIQKIFEHEAASLAHLNNDKRSIANGKNILERYVDTYKDDPWTVYYDDKGPFIERSFEVPFGNCGHHIHGTIDAVLRNTETDELVVCDHKTATSFSDLAKRVNPNLQFSIYIWALQKMGLPITRMMVNGIQVAKTKCDFVRIFTSRTRDDFDELAMSVLSSISDYKNCLDSGLWPMSTASCSHYGGCQYHDVCSLDKSLRTNAINQIYGSLLGSSSN